jgi:ATP-dependent Clp protease adaptor protein ClpS
MAPTRFDLDSERDESVATERKRKTKRPRRWRVVLHNDDYTTMEFVVEVLMRHFHKPPAEAFQIMLEVHYKGAGVAGVYPKDVAETKIAEVMAEARDSGMPLKLTAEPEGAAGDAGGSGEGET